MNADGVKHDKPNNTLIGRRGRPSAAETQERMAAVLRAARVEFAERGFHAATMATIAKRAGVSKRSLYMWHEDKAALFCAVVSDASRHLRLAAFDPASDLYEGLLNYAISVRREFCTEYSLQVARLMLREGDNFPEIYAAVREAAGYVSKPVESQLVYNGFDSKEAAQLAQLFMGMLLSDIQQYAVMSEATPKPENEEGFVKLVVRLFVTGASGERSAPNISEEDKRASA